MSNDIDSKGVIAQFAEVATLAGIKGKIDETGERYEAMFVFEDERSQMVYARAIRTPGGPGVCVYSPAAKYKKGMFGGISKEAAIELLKRNENLWFARYGIRELDDALLVVASIDVLVESLDADELNAAVRSVSAAADTWEEKAGKGDDF